MNIPKEQIIDMVRLMGMVDLLNFDPSLTQIYCVANNSNRWLHKKTEKLEILTM
jgi:hypothetical protein